MIERLKWQIVFTNVGNPHALGQKPLTFSRQVISASLAIIVCIDEDTSSVQFDPVQNLQRTYHAWPC